MDKREPDMVMVPREPTERMLRAAAGHMRVDTLYTPKSIWRAMLSAAPSEGGDEPSSPGPAMDDLAKLKEAAEKATPGPWYPAGPPWFDVGSGVLAGSPDPHVGVMIADTEAWEGQRAEQGETYTGRLADPDDDAAFIARANPETILALISAHASALARVAVLEGALREMLDQYGSKYDHEMRRKEPPELEVIEAARAALRTEGEGQ